jgi:hypothetical protein
MKKFVLKSLILAFCFSVVSAFAVSANAKPTLELYWDGQQNSWRSFFVLDVLKRRLGDRVDFKIVCLSDKKSGKLVAVTGENDLDEEKRIAVISQKYGNKVLDYISARSLNPMPNAWEEAASFVGISPSELDKEVKRSGTDLLEKQYETTKGKHVGGGLILLDGKQYSGAFTPLNFLSYVNESLPQAQRISIPAIVKPNQKKLRPKIWVIVDKNHPEGKENMQLVSGIVSLLGSTMKPDVQIATYDTARAKKVQRDLDVNVLPFYALENSKEVREAFQTLIQRGIAKIQGNYIVLNAPGGGVYPKQKRKPNLLEVFVMSQCPYGVMAENSLEEAILNGQIASNIRIKIRYIVSVIKDKSGNKTFRSLHGSAEWEEDARQIWIQEHHPDKFWKYLKYRNEDPTSSMWRESAKKAGLNPNEIEQNFEGAKKLLEADAEYVQALGISGSPSFLWEGKISVGGIKELKEIKGFENISSEHKAAPGGQKCN